MPAEIHQTVKDLALRVPGATRVFERVGIDYCCGGGRSLEDACAVAGVSAEDLVATLRALEATDRKAGRERDFGSMKLEALMDHIVGTHHVFTAAELERLAPLLAKVRSKHERNHPELADVAYAFDKLVLDLLPHMRKEEQVLFPYIAALEHAVRDGRSVELPPFVTVRNPIRCMTQEHEAAGDLLREIRAATGNFELPEDACMSFRALYEGLEELERDLHQHIHLENNILFPSAAGLEENA
jgi:regulator of cell morphogenesis and NO signaling